MKKMQLQDWRGKEIAQIETRLEELSAKLTGAYLAKSAGKLANVSMVKNLRRELAQLKTLRQEKMAAVARVERYNQQEPKVDQVEEKPVASVASEE
jgi:ribosomal protein L29